MTNARCASPVRRCIDLSVNQTVIGKKYWPRCAIVSRCGEESGCCYSPDHVCTVAESHLIDLYFFYVTFEANSRAGVDRLTFENHTKCECRPRPPSIPSTLTAILPNDQPTPNNWPSYSNRQQDSLSYDSQTENLQQPLVYQSEDVREDQHGIENTFHAEPLRRQPDDASDEDASHNEINGNGPLRQTPPPPEPERHHVVVQSEPERHHVGAPSDPERRPVVAQSEPEYRPVVVQSEPGRHHVTGRGRDKPRDDGNIVKSLDSEAATDNSMELKTTRSSASETNLAADVITSGSCTCPEVYFPSLSPSVPGACECVCDATTGNCRRLMKGKRYFKAKDEKCILSGECGVPTCKFGPFLPNYKRCPRKREVKKGRNRS